MTNQPIHVLSTRPLSDELIEEAATQGIVLDTISFISTTALEDEDLGRRIGDLANGPLVAVFTSMNAVNAVTGWLRKVPDTWRIFCIDSATRQLAEQFFGAQRIAGTAVAASALAERIIRWEGWGPAGSVGLGGHGREVYFFCGDHRREELPSILRQQGITVNEWIVYRTILTPHKVERLYDGIAFFSPSAVESYFSINAVAGRTRMFAIGRTTAAAIGEWCHNPVDISDRPEKDALIRNMIEYFSNKRKDKASDHTQE